MHSRQLAPAVFSRLLALALLFILTNSAAFAAASLELRTDHLRSQLVSASNTATPGQTLKLGLLLQHDEHWHTYWKNAGDSGNATTLTFSLPVGVTASEIEWPLPERLPVQGLVNYGYSHRVLLPVTLSVPTNFSSKTLDITLKADWLVCMEECIPGEGEYKLSLPVQTAAASSSEWAKDFERSATRQPKTATGSATYHIQGDMLTVDFSGDLPADFSSWLFFPEIPQHITNAATPEWKKTDTGWQARLPVSEYFVKAAPEFPVLLVKGGAGLRFTAAYAETAAASAKTATTFSLAAFLPALGLALLGGLVLNLMPCVFPVLSFKALAVLEQADNRPALRRQGIFYALGVIASFLLLAGLLLILRNAGEQIGWGFQLQEPRFVAALALLFFLMALSFVGLLEIGAGFAGLGQSLTEGHGDRSAFFTGVLACVVASPCTAPFMGTALGYALSQPTLAALAVFAALGLGLALPILLLGFIPALARLLPRPGAWMESFRQFLAFPLLLTVVWLLWVYGEQTSTLAMAWLLAALVLLAFGIWLRSKAKARALTLLAWLVIAVAVASPLLKKSAEPEKVSSTAEAWSAEKLAGLRAEKKPVLVNMTAAWCITCLANERSTLSTEGVKSALAKHGVTYLKGDWTRQDPAITEYLSAFGRNGVPLYVLYPAEGEPQVLPQILTPALIENALDSLGSPAP
ncbi:MAG: protein-disulfide reductase DsbD family protein [Pedobacter sp.]|nr:protein-disulfide reductase DsbD family protein [Pedobacter sp.]